MSVFAGRPIIAVVRHHDAATARVIAFAAADVLPAVEVTYTVPGASELIADLIRHDRAVTRETLVGAGTVCDAATARQAIAAGARFLVAPNFDAAVAEPGKTSLGLDIGMFDKTGFKLPLDDD